MKSVLYRTRFLTIGAGLAAAAGILIAGVATGNGVSYPAPPHFGISGGLDAPITKAVGLSVIFTTIVGLILYFRQVILKFAGRIFSVHP